MRIRFRRRAAYSIQRLDIEPGDKLVLTVPKDFPPDTARFLAQRIESQLPVTVAVVLPNVVGIIIIKESNA